MKEVSRNTYKCCEADKFDDNKTTNGEEDATGFPKAIVKNHGHGLGCAQYFGNITQAETQYNVEQESSDVGEQHGKRNSPWSLDFWFRNPSCC